MMDTKPLNGKIFLILLTAAFFGILAVLPYTLSLQGAALEKISLPMPLPVLLAIQVVQNTVMFAGAIWLGLFLANRCGLGLPILEAKLGGAPIANRVLAVLPVAILFGVGASVLVMLLDQFFFQPQLLASMGQAAQALSLTSAQPEAWKGLLASFYGGINEELLLRLFVFSLLAWLGKFISHTEQGLPTLTVLWVANILAALLFGLGHLPATATILPLTPLVVGRALLLNGLAGIGFGYLYWTRGLEAAMISHFSADIVLHVLLAL